MASPEGFPKKHEIEAAIPAGRLPYIRLAKCLGLIAKYGDNHSERLIRRALEEFELAAQQDKPEPPLTPELDDLLTRAVLNDVIALSDGETPLRDSTSEALLLLYAIADHGSNPLGSLAAHETLFHG